MGRARGDSGGVDGLRHVPNQHEPDRLGLEQQRCPQRQHIGEREFEELMFVNPVRLHAEMNPQFFDGTRVAES